MKTKTNTVRSNYEKISSEFQKKTGKKITKGNFEILKRLMERFEIKSSIIVDEDEYRSFQIFYEDDTLVGFDYKLGIKEEGEPDLFEEELTEEKRRFGKFFNRIFNKVTQENLNKFVEIEMAAYEFYHE